AQTCLIRLTRKHLEAMLALRTGRDLYAFPHEIEALRHGGVVLRTHVVKRAKRRRIFRQEDEFAAVRLERPLREQPLACWVEIARLRGFRDLVTHLVQLRVRL